MYILYTNKNDDAIDFDECLNELLDVYKFRIAVISKHLNSMPVKTEVDECEYQHLKRQLMLFQKSYDDLNVRESMQRENNVTPIEQYSPKITENIK